MTREALHVTALLLVLSLSGCGTSDKRPRTEIVYNVEPFRAARYSGDDFRGTDLNAIVSTMVQAALADPARNVAREDAFPRIEDRASCRRCPFRRPCGRL